MAISAAALARMQALTNGTLDQSVTIKRNTGGVSDGAGGSTEVVSTIATTVCHVGQPSQGLMQNYDYLIGTTDTTLIRFAIGTNVQENDLLIVGGQTLRVQLVLTPRSYPVALQVLAAEVQ